MPYQLLRPIIIILWSAFIICIYLSYIVYKNDIKMTKCVEKQIKYSTTTLTELAECKRMNIPINIPKGVVF